MCRNTERHLDTHASPIISSAFSQEVTYFNTHSHIQKGEKIGLKTASIRTTKTAKTILRGDLTAQRDREMHKHWQGSV